MCSSRNLADFLLLKPVRHAALLLEHAETQGIRKKKLPTFQLHPRPVLKSSYFQLGSGVRPAIPRSHDTLHRRAPDVPWQGSCELRARAEHSFRLLSCATRGTSHAGPAAAEPPTNPALFATRVYQIQTLSPVPVTYRVAKAAARECMHSLTSALQLAANLQMLSTDGMEPSRSPTIAGAAASCPRVHVNGDTRSTRAASLHCHVHPVAAGKHIGTKHTARCPGVGAPRHQSLSTGDIPISLRGSYFSFRGIGVRG